MPPRTAPSRRSRYRWRAPAGWLPARPRLPEQAQVARDRRLADARLAGELGGRAVAVAGFLRDHPAAGVGEGLGGGEFVHRKAIAACL